MSTTWMLMFPIKVWPTWTFFVVKGNGDTLGRAREAVATKVDLPVLGAPATRIVGMEGFMAGSLDKKITRLRRISSDLRHLLTVDIIRPLASAPIFLTSRGVSAPIRRKRYFSQNWLASLRDFEMHRIAKLILFLSYSTSIKSQKNGWRLSSRLANSRIKLVLEISIL